jgi:uncharacterized protein YuzE
MPASTYDPESDAAYIYLGDSEILESEEVSPGIVLDFDAEGRVVGIEVLSASRTLAPGDWKRWPVPGVDPQAHAAE